MIEICNLVERPDLIEVTARWGWETWGRPSGHQLAQHLLRRQAIVAARGFEQCFILLDDAIPAAMAALVRSDLDQRPDLTPWLAGVYVDPPFRGRGHAARVVRAVEQAAGLAGVTRLWLYTASAAGLYRRLGWQDDERVLHPKGPALLMRRDLGTDPV